VTFGNASWATFDSTVYNSAGFVEDKFGFSVLEGFEIPIISFLSKKGYLKTLKTSINSRDIDFIGDAGRSGSRVEDTSLDGMSYFP